MTGKKVKIKLREHSYKIDVWTLEELVNHDSDHYLVGGEGREKLLVRK
jgi:hypothetical protein